MTFSRTLTQDGQLRWIGPEKGVLALACGAILNAVWDMWSRKEGKPLWEMVCDMEPAQLIECIDFKHITDVITPEEALELLESKRPGWESRKKHMQEDGCALPSSSVHRAHKKLTRPPCVRRPGVHDERGLARLPRGQDPRAVQGAAR